MRDTAERILRVLGGRMPALLDENRKDGVIGGKGEVGYTRDLEEDLGPRNSSLNPY